MRFIDYIHRAQLQEAEQLDENRKQYEQMFQGVIQAYQLVDTNEGYADMIAQRINSYRILYKRNDRVVWALRWFRMYLVNAIAMTGKTGNDKVADPRVEKFVAKQLKGMMSQTGASQAGIESEADYFMTGRFDVSMNHLMTMTDRIPALDQVIFGTEGPTQIKTKLEAIETEWKDNQSRLLDPTEESYENAEKMIDFGDGFAWWNLGVDGCSEEGTAMGHCGNSGWGKDDDTVLSLRKRQTFNDETHDVPYLTFILRDDGYLGEMKGRGNEKPAKRYHPYIIALLRHDAVAGLKGGGHASQNNFSLNDLERDVKEELLAEKPELLPAIMKLENSRMSEELLNIAVDEASKIDFPGIHGTYDLSKSEVALYKWSDAEDFLSDFEYYATIITAVHTAMSDSDEDEIRQDFQDNYKLSEEDAKEILMNLPSTHIQKIIDDIGIEGSPRDFKVIARAALYIDRAYKYYPILQDAAIGAASIKMLIHEPDFYEYVKAIIHLVSFENHHVSLEFGGDTVDDPIFLVINWSAYVDLIIEGTEAGDEDDYYDSDDSGVIYNLKSYEGSWSATYDDHGDPEAWTDETSWWRENNKEVLDKFNPGFEASINGNIDVIDHSLAASRFVKLVNWNEAKEEEANMGDFLTEMRKRAGV